MNTIKTYFATQEEAEKLYAYSIISKKLLEFCGQSKDELLFSWSKKIAQKLIDLLKPRLQDEEFDEEIYILELTYLMDEYALTKEAISMYGRSPYKAGWLIGLTNAMRELI